MLLDITKSELLNYRDIFGTLAAAKHAAFCGLPLGIARAWLLG